MSARGKLKDIQSVSHDVRNIGASFLNERDEQMFLLQAILHMYL